MIAAPLLFCAALLLLGVVAIRAVLRVVEAIDKRTRRTWLQLGNVISMLQNAGYKVKKPRDWGDDFAETQFRDSSAPVDPRDWDDE